MSTAGTIIAAATSLLDALAAIAKQSGDAQAEADLRRAMAALQRGRDEIDDVFAEARDKIETMRSGKP